jgi:GNAT superfamily N-acetyltransferase
VVRQVSGGVKLRPFTTEDWPAALGIADRLFPVSPRSLEGALHWDSKWEADKYFRERLVAEDSGGRMVGTASLAHMPWQFSPHTYRFNAEVDPDVQRQGIGSLLFEALLETARRREATLVRSEAKETLVASLDFLRNRGFEEIQRSWESRLDVAAFDLDAFATAEPRAAQQGLEVTTLAAELAAAGEGNEDVVLRGVYALDTEASLDEPSFEPITVPPYEKWRDNTLSAPNALHEAFFLMKDGDRYVGLSELQKNLVLADVLQQGFTAVARSHRGKGVAMALKVRGVRFARERGYREIRTGNNTRNRPMLRINEAMGFVKQPVWIEYGKSL